MSFATGTSRAASPDLVNRRLAIGLLLSLLLHAMVLSLQFGVPGLGLPSPFKPRPVSITIVTADPAPPALDAAPAKEPPPPVQASTGMRVLAPAARPAPTAPPVAKAKPARPAKPRRISRPLPPPEPVEAPTRVIAQDQNPNDSFVVPLPQPQESEQKTVDPKEARNGADDGDVTETAQLAEEKRKEELAAAQAAEAKAEQEAQARLLAAKQAEDDARKLAEDVARQQAARAEALKNEEQQRRAEQELAARRQAEEQDRRQAALRQQQLDEVAAREQADQLLRQQLAQEQLRKQQADQLAAKQKADELAIRQKAEELALRQKAEELALKQKAEELALKQKADELAAKQRADELAARQKAAETARQQAEQVAAAGQRERERAAANAAPAGAGDRGAGAGGSGATLPKNLFGSDLGNRVRELSRGIDVLSGTPPQRPHADDERAGRRVVVGSAERDVPLRMYVDSFCQKVERNGGLAFSPMSGERVRIDPLVSVAIRSDGSVEDVTIVRSSGHPDIDSAVRRIVRVNARYSAFPPNIAAKFDVIEIRRIWSFAESLKLLEEVR